MITINELKAEPYNDDAHYIGYLNALNDVLKLLKTNKTKEEVIKEIEG